MGVAVIDALVGKTSSTIGAAKVEGIGAAKHEAMARSRACKAEGAGD